MACRYSKCTNVLANTNFCKRHAKFVASNKIKWIKRRKLLGICSHCPNKLEKKESRCKECKDKENLRKRQLTVYRRKNKLCTSCGTKRKNIDEHNKNGNKLSRCNLCIRKRQ